MGTVQDGMSSILTCEECVKDCEKKKNFTAAAAQTDADQKKPSKKRGSNMKKLLKKRGPILALVAVLILFGTVSGYNAATQKAKAEQSAMDLSRGKITFCVYRGISEKGAENQTLVVGHLK